MADLGFWQFAAREPEAPALVGTDGVTWSRGELCAEANRTAHALRELGLARGDCVALVAPNCREFFVLYLGAMQIGLYLVPINWHLAEAEIAHILKDSEAKAFVASGATAELAASCIAAAEAVDFPSPGRICIGALEGFTPLEEFLAGQPDHPPADPSAGSVMNYTSGTTGRPKGVRRALIEGSPDEIYSLYAMYMMMFGITVEDDNVHIVGSPLYHTAVLVWAGGSLHLGHKVVVMERFDPEQMLRLIAEHRVTTSHMVPTQFHRLLALPEKVRARYDCSSTRRMVHAAAPCPPHVKHAMIDWWKDAIWEYYAATEGGGTMVAPQEWLQYPGTVGKPWAGSEVRIIDDDGNDCPPGQQGTVYMLLGQSQFEYKDDLKKTRDNRLGDFFTVGDVGYLDEDGYLFLCDRKIDMIISGGANIYPAEIENTFLMHPGVGDVAVFGIPNEEWGEEIKAVVQPAADATPGDELTAELLDFCKEHLGRMKLPRSIDYLDELPRDPNGKLYKRRLRDPYWQGRKRQV